MTLTRIKNHEIRIRCNVRRADCVNFGGDGFLWYRFMSDIKIGDMGCWKGVLCKVKDIDGGVVFLETPHGTVLKMGFFYLANGDWRDMTPEELERYKAYEVDASHRMSTPSTHHENMSK